MSSYPSELDHRIYSDTSRHPPFTSASTLRSPSPSSDMRLSEKIMAGEDQGRITKMDQRASPDSYAAVGQLSYGPTTQTTVVTTTTTTTTSLPPFFVPDPSHLHKRDPKQYPLASSPTPHSLRRFKFNYMGHPISFEEGENMEKNLQELSNTCATAHNSNDTTLPPPKLNDLRDTPDRLSSDPKTKALVRASNLDAPRGKKRAASPVSISEAAEIASLHRMNKKQRPSLQSIIGRGQGSSSLVRRDERMLSDDGDATIPATPDTDTGIIDRFQTSKVEPGASRGRQTSRKSSNSQSSSATEHSQVKTEENTGPSWSTSSTFTAPNGPTSPTATPPVVETDMELVATETQIQDMARPPPPRPLQTTSLQDASLPSPSLSPITAAANLNNGGRRVDDNDVSSLDISQETALTRRSNDGAGQVATPTGLDHEMESNPSSHSLMDIPRMLDTYDAMPDELKTYIMYQFLRRSAKPTLHLVADVVNPALKCDFLDLLPLELSLNILKYLDVKSLCRAAQVSKKWRHIVNSDEKGWKDLLDQDEYALPDGEVERAVREGWGWQYPHSANSFERDLSSSHGSREDNHVTSASSPHSFDSIDSDTTTCSAVATSVLSRPKRKAAAKFSSNKRPRRKGPSPSKSRSPSWIQSLENASGPIAYSSAAAKAVPNPQVGLPSLRSLHLFKTLYQRHHLIRKSWMDMDTKPQHIAFRAHVRHVVTCLQFDTDKILTGSDDTNINVYDAKTGALRNRLEGHEGGVWALQYEGNTLVSGSTDRSVRVWDIEKGRCTQTFQGHTSTVRCLVILKPTVIGEDSHGRPIMMPEEPLIITGSRDSSLRVWKLPQPGDKQFFQSGAPANDYSNPYFVRTLTGHHQSVRAIAAHGDTLVSGSYDTSVRVWKISTGELLHRLQGHQQKVYSVVLDHERNRCISGSMDTLVKVWSLDSGACLFNLEGHTSLVGLLDLSHSRLVSAAADSTLRIWDPESGRCKSTLSAHTGAITCFQHDGQKVISGSDRTLKMWDVQTGECTKDLLTDLSGVWQVKFNDRRCVAAVQRDGLTYIEVLDFGAVRDGVPADQLGRRIVVNSKGKEVDDHTDAAEDTV